MDQNNYNRVIESTFILLATIALIDHDFAKSELETIKRLSSIFDFDALEVDRVHDTITEISEEQADNQLLYAIAERCISDIKLYGTEKQKEDALEAADAVIMADGIIAESENDIYSYMLDELQDFPSLV